ncbi:MAG: hypothetical protein A2W01_09380 [Candidatus Solincola sediminis]|uniref:HTH marR-type domain-containing protein n=1 Tax=Candidatus Solincola sediminis TaxID=1797199 RepID=A0A1F2WH14_9ACTN|nr:MAG: hypothetical protein A2Y75_03230 [Candidatus Solincola sediminis]OFW60448.1 MAG: hypothetical protein A2W01_09380 [Candidatus Solincola sediminis]
MKKKEESRIPNGERAIPLILLSMRLMHGLGAQALGDTGLRPPQVAFLGFLHHAGPLKMGSISQLTNVTVSVATRFIERLENKGLVERVADESDRRVVLVRLTGEGHRLADAVIETYNQKLDKALEGIEPRDFEVFISVLTQINEKLASELPMEGISEMFAAHLRGVKEGFDEKQ